MQHFYRIGLLGLVFLTLICCCSNAFGQAKFKTTETIATSTTTDNQSRPAIAQANNGNFIIVWEGENQDGSDYGIYAQVFDSSGNIIVPEYLVNGSTQDSSQRSPAVAMDNSGNYTIAWMSEFQDNDGWGCYRRGYDATGALVASSSRLNSSSTGNQKHPDIAMDTSGNYVTVFEDNDDDGDGFGIQMRRTNSSHANLASSESVNDSTAGNQTNPAIGMDATGNFVVVWQSEGTDGDGQGIYAKVYDNTGTATVNQFQVNTTTVGNQQEPDVFMAEDGSFVIIWSSYAQDGDAYGIYAQRYTSAGVPNGTETLVNSTTSGSQDHSSIAGTRTNDYVISWGSYGQDGSFDGVYYQIFQADGTVFGEEARANIRTNDFQQFPAIAWRDTSLQMMMTWQSGLYNSSSTQDGSGYGIVYNSAVVADTSAPDANCTNITTFLDGTGSVSIVATDVDNGSTDNVGIVSYSVSQSTFACADTGLAIVILTVADSAGNSSTCAAAVTISDTTSPTASCTNLTVYLDGSGAVTILGSDLDGGSTDNCGVASFTAATTSFSCTEVGSNSVVVTVTDVSGNSSTCTGTVVVEDSTSPTAVCQDITAFLDANGTATISSSDIDNGSTDNCSNITLSASPTGFTCTEIGSNSVTLTVTDPGGNTAVCSSNVTVQDSVSPTAVCQDVTAYLDGAGSVTVTSTDVDGGSTDNCGVSSFSLNVSTFSCADIGTNAYTLTVADGNGNSSTCSGTIQVSDTISPTLVCQDITVHLDGSGAASITTGDIDNGSSDNCTLSSLSADVTSFGCTDVGSVTVTLTGTDNSGNTGSCTSTVTVEDSTSPTAVCQDVTLSLDGTGNATLTTSDVDNGSSDNCGIASLSLSQTAFACTDIGTQTATLTVADTQGNTSTCTANIIIQDTTSPSAVCQALSVFLDGSGSASITTADVDGGSSDNCGISSSSLSASNFSCSDIGTVNLVLTVTDSSGNSNTCTSALVVSDTTSPSLVCQDITVHLDGNGTASITTGDIDNGSSDNCTLSSLSANVTSFTCTDVGTVTVTLTGTDSSSNTGSCTSTVTVEDSTSPTAVCQDVTLSLDGTGNATLTTSDVDNGSSDNCSLSSLSLSSSSFTCSDLGVNSVILTATDSSGNTSTCTSTVTVQDSTDPVAICQDVTIYLNASGSASVTATDVGSSSTDNCTVNSTTLDNTSFFCFDAGSNTVTLTVDDQSGNTSTCTANITVVDTTSPVVACQNITVQLDGAGSATLAASDIDNGSSDNCGIQSTVVSDTSFACSDIGSNSVTLTVEDIYGNSSNCTATVVVEDTISPGVLCQNLTVYLDGNGSATIVAGDIDGGTSDNCGLSSLSLSSSNFSCSNLGANLIDLTAVDSSGNSNTCTATVTVEDSIAPTALCSDITISLGAAGTVSIATSDIDNGSADNCTISSLVLSASSFACSDIGANTVTLSATDQSNNLDSCTSNVFVQDTNPPVVVCNPLTVSLDANGQASISTSDIDGGSTDNCAIASLTLNVTSFTCSDVGTVQVTMTGIDSSGNTSTCISTVIVEDTIAPVANCISNLTVTLDSAGTASVSTSDIDNGSSDNCAIQTASISQSSWTCLDTGLQSITLTITDSSGNSDSCVSSLLVQDTALPTAICQDITAFLDANGQVVFSASDIDNGSNDNCGISSQQISIDTLDCSNIGINQVTLLVSDPSGNTDSCTANVTVEDSLAPVASCQDITVYLDQTGNAVVTGNDVAPASSDNCGFLYSLSGDSLDCSNIGSNQVLVTVTDVAGLTATCTSNVTVEDSIAPVVSCVNITVTLPANNNVTITIMDVTSAMPTDNCNVLPGSLDISNFDCSNAGVNTVTVSIPDGNGNTGICTAQVTVIDSLPPMAVCQDITVSIDAAGSGSATPADADAGSVDNCGIDSSAISQDMFSCADVGQLTETLYIYDLFGNIDSCDFVVTVQDIIPPVALCSPDTIIVDTGDVVFITGADIDGGSSDNCGIASMVADPDSFTTAILGSNSVVLTVTDLSGNTDTCNTTVFVEQLVGVVEEVTLDASVQFDAYPNPTQGILTVDINCVDCVFKTETTLSLVDMRGKVLKAQVLNRNRGSHTLEIDMSQFAVGNYLLRLESERGTAVQQIIKY